MGVLVKRTAYAYIFTTTLIYAIPLYTGKIAKLPSQHVLRMFCSANVLPIPLARHDCRGNTTQLARFRQPFLPPPVRIVRSTASCSFCFLPSDLTGTGVRVLSSSSSSSVKTAGVQGFMN